MLFDPVEAAERRAARLSRRVALGGAGTLCAATGAGFLTVAAWLVLDAYRGPVFAAGVIGALYLGVGLIFWALALQRDRNAHRQDPPDPYAPFVHMAEGFAAGIEAGRAAREGAR